MRTFVGDDEFVQPKRNETAPRSECRPTLKNALTQPRLLEMDEKSAFRTSDPLVQLLLTDQCARRREREVIRVPRRATELNLEEC